MIRKALWAGALSSFAIAVLAHNGATGVVMDRMMGMVAMRDVMASLAPMMQGQVPFEVRTVQEGAARIMAHSGENMTRLFPDGSLQTASFAKPEIWTKWEEFTALSEQLRTYALGLGMAAPNGLTGPTPVSTTSHASHGGAMDHGSMSMEAPTAAADASGDEMMDHSNMQMGTSAEGQTEPPAPAYTVAELMGVVRPASLARSTPKAAADVTLDFTTMTAAEAFEKVGQVCSSCHARFRSGN